MKCGEGDSILLATTNSKTPIHKTVGVCVNRKSELCIINLAIILFIYVKPALLPCWFSLSKLASGVDNVWFGYVRKDELTVVVKSSQDGWKEARALREWLEYQRGNVEGALCVFDSIDLHVAILRLQSSFTEKPSRKAHSLPDSLHGIFKRADGLVLEAIYLKTKSLQKLRRLTEAASECKSVLDAMESMFQHSILDLQVGTKLQKIVSQAIELIPELWKQAESHHEAISAYCLLCEDSEKVCSVVAVQWCGGCVTFLIWKSIGEVASVGTDLSSVAPGNDKDRIGMKWDIGQRKSKHLVVRKLHNIHLSIEEGIWDTQVMNGPILEEVFDKSDRVILVFSVNMSGLFQGYAQMMSSVGCRRDNVWSQGTGGNSEFGVGLAWVLIRICDGTNALFHISSFGLEYVTVGWTGWD
ncbi:hypothetical protein Nepgr_003324 [Nepenthes gracilis]|uniref:YTH domain-containing protein n=1 Tax=Nepenthes gracilis TaxID=150966 RepID=A0AAD3XDM8_NEPGR|nr:hypothetical protein Nepgr_003324 [Nepenthes gracilis]